MNAGAHPWPDAATLRAQLAALEAAASVQFTASGAADGPGICWRRWGAPDPVGRMPRVFFHGGSGSWNHWAPTLAACLARGDTVWAVDLPGFGDSDRTPGALDADGLVAPLVQGLRALFGVARPVDLVGFSFGGLTAGLLAAEHPESVARLVLVGAPAMGVVSGRQFELSGWRHLADRAAQREVHRQNLLALMLRDPASVTEEVLDLHEHNLLRDRMPRRRLAHTAALAQVMPRLEMPLQAIYGEFDAVYGPAVAQLPRAFAVAPGFRGFEMVPGAGHWVQYEAAAAFVQALDRAWARDF